MVSGLAKVYHHVHPLVELITCSGEGVLSMWHTMNRYMKTKLLR